MVPLPAFSNRIMIRKFQLTDLGRILEIEAQSFPKSSYPAQVFLDYYRILPRTFLVLEEESVLAYIIFEPDGHVISLAVDPSRRRSGIGRSLMQACEARCNTNKLLVEVRERNLGARRFYERLGFQTKARIGLYYGAEDAFVMEKEMKRVS
jgi:ribosomal-protein-alanine N-acetyltransferase